LIGLRKGVREVLLRKPLAYQISISQRPSALNHANIKSTLRYAHVLDSEVADDLERLAESRKNPEAGCAMQVKLLYLL
jgi:hypothetical protein